jgi:multidrug resistance efflux pump
MFENRKKLMTAIVGVIAAVLVIIVSYYWYNNTFYVKTEDAKVAGDIVKVTTQITGKLLELNVNEGDTLVKEQIIGRQDMGSLSDSYLEQSIIRSPIDGFVVKKQGAVGEMASTSQVLVYMIDPAQLYINANIEETQLSKLKIGQKVDITVDEYSVKKMTGKIEAIGKAASSAFSLLPTSTSGTFTKVVQRVPVKISLDQNYDGLLLGTNAIVKIHIK